MINKLRAEIRDCPKTVVFPEGLDERVLRAAEIVAKDGIITPVLLGKTNDILACIENLGLNPGIFNIVDPNSSPKLDKYVQSYCLSRGLPAGAAERIVRQPLYFGGMMVREGEADAMVAGASHNTEDVIMAAELTIGLQVDVNTPSSFMIMDIPHYIGPQEGLLVFADPALNPDPTYEQLAEIAISTARSVTKMLHWQPRIALLSFSTKGSAIHPTVDKIVEAVKLIKMKAPELDVDGELQVDAAINMEVAKRKVKDVSTVAGRANILIFPDLNSANIGYKLVQRLAGAKAYGPVLQGFSHPLTDLSRGASVEDIVGAIILVVSNK